MNETRIGSLFTGYGGLTMGVAAAIGGDARTIYTCDIEPGPTAIERYHAGADGPANLGDITQVDWDAQPPVDVIKGGSPCQSLSLAGLRAGMHAGTRSGLWSYQADAIAAQHPSLAVWENVGGALTAATSSREDVARADRRAKALNTAGLCACETPGIDWPEGFRPPTGEAETQAPAMLLDWAGKHGLNLINLACTRCGLNVYERTPKDLRAGTDRLPAAYEGPAIRALGRVLGDLANLGYDAIWRTLKASDVGLPHRRLRLFVTAWPRTPKPSDSPIIRALDALPPIRPAGDPWAMWDADRDCWTDGQPDLLGGGDVMDGPWPACGAMADGAAWRLNADSPSNPHPLPPTPIGRDGGQGGAMDPRAKRAGNHAVTLQDVAEKQDGTGLLPTPTASQDTGENGSQSPAKRRAGGHEVRLLDLAEHDWPFLPTPQAHDSQAPRSPESLKAARARRNAGFANLNASAEQDMPLLYTPKASDGLFACPRATGRPVSRATFLSTQVLWLGGWLRDINDDDKEES